MEKRFTQEQILRALKSNEVGMEVVDICCELDIDEQTFYRWHTKYSGMEVAEVKRIRAPEAENAKSEESLIESDLGEAAFSQEPLTNSAILIIRPNALCLHNLNRHAPHESFP